MSQPAESPSMTPEAVRLPIIPERVLRAHKVREGYDTRFRSAARLRQALWREEQGLPIGVHRPREGLPRKMGSRISQACGVAGGNFLSPRIARLVTRELAYREPGAFLDEERVRQNLLSSMPLTFSVFGLLKLDPDLANRVMRRLFPELMAEVVGVDFEHSPGRGHPAYTEDGTAFDVVVRGRDEGGRRTFAAIEIKYSESMAEPLATPRPRYDALSRECGLYRDPDAAALRANPLQQLWREHMLAQALVRTGRHDRGVFVLAGPALNEDVGRAASLYRDHLADAPDAVRFDAVTLDTLIDLIVEEGEPAGVALRHRYLDFAPVHALI